MHTVRHHTRPPPYPFADPKNCQLHRRSENSDSWPRVSLGSRFFLTHPMLPGATLGWRESCKCVDIMMVSLSWLSHAPTRTGVQPSVIITDITLSPVLRFRFVLRVPNPACTQLTVITRALPVSRHLQLHPIPGDVNSVSGAPVYSRSSSDTQHT